MRECGWPSSALIQAVSLRVSKKMPVAGESGAACRSRAAAIVPMPVPYAVHGPSLAPRRSNWRFLPSLNREVLVVGILSCRAGVRSGWSRKAAYLLARDRRFESIFLHRRVREPSVPPETKSDRDAQADAEIRPRQPIRPPVEHALALDPQSAEAQSQLAYILVNRAQNGMTDSAAADLAATIFFVPPLPLRVAHTLLVLIQCAIARPIAGPESSWMKCTPGTVTSAWFFQLRQNSRTAPIRIAPGSAFTNSFGNSLPGSHSL